MKLTRLSAHPTILELLPGYEKMEGFLLSLPSLFQQEKGQLIHDGRNQLRVLEFEGEKYVVKAYRKPFFINRLIYGFFRPSKAKRSLENALLLRSIGVGTPEPIGYINQRNGFLFTRSFFVTRISTCPYRYDMLFQQHFDCEEKVLREIGRITAKMHEHGISHLDYGRGNILFDKMPSGEVRLELVDLNRIKHGPVDMVRGCKNLERLPATAQMHRHHRERRGTTDQHQRAQRRCKERTLCPAHPHQLHAGPARGVRPAYLRLYTEVFKKEAE